MAATSPVDNGSRPSIVGSEAGPAPPFPLRLNGKVIKGFGRGSKELGIPTANIPVEGLSVGGHDDVASGVYYGWAGLRMSGAVAAQTVGSKHGARQEGIASQAQHGGQHVLAATDDAFHSDTPHLDSKLKRHLDSTQVYPMVMSIGWNPFYKNSRRSIEVHVMHDFNGSDFYDAHMNLIILGFIRPELDYVSKEKLIQDIRTDIAVAERSLRRPAYEQFENDGYLTNLQGPEQGEMAS